MNSRRESWVPYAMLLAAIMMLAVAGYRGYVLYPRFDLPAVTGLGLLALAVAAGVASFFSPCSFPLLVTILARTVSPPGEGAGGREGRSRAALGFAAPFALGATLFLLLVGAGIALGGAALFAGVTYTSTAGRVIRITVGSLLIVLGMVQSERVPLSFHGAERLTRPVVQAQARLRRQRPILGAGLFGFAYLLAGFG